MIVRFPSYELAALYAARTRDEGRFAEICDESVATLWGPGAVGGFRVIVSEQVMTTDNPPPAPGWFQELVFAIGRSIVLFLWITSGLALGLVLLRLVVIFPVEAFVLSAVLAVTAGLVVYGGAAISILSHRLLADSQFGKSEVGWSAGLILLLILTLLIILVMT